MRRELLGCMLAAGLAATPTHAREPVDATGVWFGTYVSHAVDYPSDSELRPRSFGRTQAPVFYVLIIDTEEAELAGSLLVSRATVTPAELAAREPYERPQQSATP